jgi:hypothetical protein
MNEKLGVTRWIASILWKDSGKAKLIQTYHRYFGRTQLISQFRHQTSRAYNPLDALLRHLQQKLLDDRAEFCEPVVLL